MPPLRERKEDIHLLFRKFASDAAEKYRMPPIQLDEEALKILVAYRWPGNIRQLKNITEQISIIEKNRIISAETLIKYLPQVQTTELPVLYRGNEPGHFTERELLYKVLFDMKKDVTDLKQLVMTLMQDDASAAKIPENSHLIKRLFKDRQDFNEQEIPVLIHPDGKETPEPLQEPEEVEESLSLEKKEIDLIRKALQKHDGKRKDAAKELGISERTLYRKIKEHGIEM